MELKYLWNNFKLWLKKPMTNQDFLLETIVIWMILGIILTII